ncbi:phosphatase PAP2 family protein [Streptacidiphilus albus]|uniref:phosphatase PAP2 family protein n=1 Tax=Streptacidiphilus albus TaxID=105425 RepID=UPI0007C86028|nr:phosphatase PAP2 family protein [Streptacidiphilus albus]
MATLLADGSDSIDWTLVSRINGFARDLPGWLDSVLSFLGEYGVPLASVLMLVVAWNWARRREDAPSAVAGVLWAGLASGIALVLNIPVRAIVQRPRPFVAHPGQLDLLTNHQANGSFASDHATFTAAIAVGLLLIHRKFGLIAAGLAAFEGFLRVFMGVHYPTDVVGGYALGTSTVLLLAPLAMAVLVPLTRSAARTAAGPLIVAPAGRPSRRSGRRAGRPHSATAPAAPDQPGDGPSQDDYLAA